MIDVFFIRTELDGTESIVAKNNINTRVCIFTSVGRALSITLDVTTEVSLLSNYYGATEYLDVRFDVLKNQYFVYHLKHEVTLLALPKIITEHIKRASNMLTGNIIVESLQPHTVGKGALIQLSFI